MITIQRGLKSAVSRPSATFAGPLRVSASRASPRIFPSAARLQNLHVSSRQTFSQRWWSRYAPRRTLRNNSSSPRPNTTEHLNSPPAKLSLKDQLKRLTKEYGRGAILVYLLFSVADLPVAFGIVRLFGPERVGAAEHAVLEQIKSLWHAVAGPITGEAAEAQTVSATSDIETATVREGIVGEEATHVAAKARDGDASKFCHGGANLKRMLTRS